MDGKRQERKESRVFGCGQGITKQEKKNICEQVLKLHYITALKKATYTNYNL